MFTRRFIKLPIRTYDREHKELTGQELIIETYEMVNPFQIQSYRPSNDDGVPCVHLTFKESSTILIYMDIKDFEKALNEHCSIANNMP